MYKDRTDKIIDTVTTVVETVGVLAVCGLLVVWLMHVM